MASTKRRKRASGWDTPASDIGAATTATTSASSGLTGILGTTAATGPLQQMAQAQAVQQLLLQRSQNSALLANPLMANMMLTNSSLFAAGGIPSMGPPSSAGRRMDCRIYVGSLHYDLAEHDIRGVFEAFGKITEVTMSYEPATGKSKGYCFIEYENPASAAQALQAMNGFELAGRQIKVGKPDGAPGMMAGSGSLSMNNATAAPAIQAVDRNTAMLQAHALVQAALGKAAPGQQQPGTTLALAAANGNAPVAAGVSTDTRNRIYVGNISTDIGPEALQTVFEPFGRITDVQILPDPAGVAKHRGYGFIQYETNRSAVEAVSQMNDFELLGRRLKVNWANSATSTLNQGMGASALTPQMLALQQSAMAQQLSALQATVSVASSNGSALETSCSSSNSLTDSTTNSTTAVSAVTATSSSEGGSNQELPRCVLLKNMVSEEEATDSELAGEIEEEGTKYGEVEKVTIHTAKTGVLIFVLYNAASSAARAQSTLHRRYFGGRIIAAELYDHGKFLAGDFGS